jgi:beta-glucosidase
MPMRLTRRDLAKIAGAGAVGVAAPASAQPSEGVATQRESARGFPNGFLWGTATAACADAPKVAAQDMQVIGSPVDFVGINIYGPAAYVCAASSYVGGAAAGGSDVGGSAVDSDLRGSAAGAAFASLPFPAKFPMMNSSWLRIAPEALYRGPRNPAKVWNVQGSSCRTTPQRSERMGQIPTINRPNHP